MKRKKDKKPVVKIKPSDYQPSVAELRKDMTIETDPEYLASCLLQDVEVREIKKLD